MNRFLFMTVVVVGVLASGVVGIMPGGISDEEKPVTSELAATLSLIQPEVEAAVRESLKGRLGLGAMTLQPMAYKSQVVAGVNYFVKYRLNKSNEYFHARIYKDLQNTLKLESVVGPKTEADPISYF